MATGLEELRVLQTAEQFSDEIWKNVVTWKEFPRDVVGKQITRAADSIGANIAEAYGRFHYGEKINLLYYARGSAFETKYWLNRCRTRGLVDEKSAAGLITRLGEIARQINSFAASLKTQRAEGKPKALRESGADYVVTNNLEEEIFDQPELRWLENTSSDSLSSMPPTVQTLITNLEIQHFPEESL